MTLDLQQLNTALSTSLITRNVIMLQFTPHTWHTWHYLCTHSLHVYPACVFWLAGLVTGCYSNHSNRVTGCYSNHSNQVTGCYGNHSNHVKGCYSNHSNPVKGCYGNHSNRVTYFRSCSCGARRGFHEASWCQRFSGELREIKIIFFLFSYSNKC